MSRKVSLYTAKNIVIRGVNWIGDAVMTLPAIGAVRHQCPDARITILANPLVAQLFQGHPWVNAVMTFDRSGRHRGVMGRVRLARELRAQKFDAALILPNSFDSAVVPWMAGIPCRVGRASDGRRLLLTESFTPDTQRLANHHESEYYRDLVAAFGISREGLVPQLLTLSETERQQSANLLSEYGVTDDSLLVGFSLGAAYGTAKRWLPERFAEVAARLADERGAQCVFIGSPSEASVADEVSKLLHGRCINLAGKTSIRELMAIIARCNLFVTNDSGPMHIAAAFDRPIVAIFGSTDYHRTFPLATHVEIVTRDADCAPCRYRDCPTDHRCMTMVTVDDVVQAAFRVCEKGRQIKGEA